MTEEHALVVETPITQVLTENYMPYAVSVILSRAIPEIDGLKPSHRKLLYTMHLMGLSKGHRSKSSNVVGQTMKLNPHGDQAIYETLVRLTTGNEALLHPYVDSKGNMGKQYSRDMASAAHRYTEVRLAPITEHLFEGIQKGVVEMVDNYDGTLKEPLLLPAAFPTILTNANQGIAVGMASNICSFNLKEICQATIALIKDPEADIQSIIQGPDFPSGGQMIEDPKALKSMLEEGTGSLNFQAIYSVDRKGRYIEITQIPYTASVEQIVEGITELVRKDRLKEITDIRDETDLHGLRITLDYKKGADPDEIMAFLFQNTKLRDSFSANFNLLIEGIPQVLGVRQILLQWHRFRRSCVEKGLRYDLDQAQKRLHLLEALEKVLLDIDKAIAIIRQTEKEKDVVPRLCQAFDIDTIQAEYVAEIKLRNLNREYILNRTKAIEDLRKTIRDLQATLKSKKKIDNLIIKKLQEVIKKYGQDRKTEVIPHDPTLFEVIEEKVDDYNLKLYVSEEGYIKKIPLTSLRSNPEIRLKDEDAFRQILEGSNALTAIFLTDGQNAYKKALAEIPDAKPSELGEYAPNLLELDDEKILFTHITADYSGEIIIGFANGKVTRFPVSAYETKQNRRKLTKAFYGGQPVVMIDFIPEGTEKDYLMRASDGKAILFKSSLVPRTESRSTQGVYAIRRKKDVVCNGMWPLDQIKVRAAENYRTDKLGVAGTQLRGEPKLIDEQMTLLGEN